MKNMFKFFLFLTIGTFLFTSCDKDDYTEEDAMDDLQHIDVALTIVDGTSYANVIDGATVELVSDTTTKTQTTDKAGNVVFSDVKIGSELAVYVHKDNYTKAAYTVSTSTSSYREKIVAKTLKIYSLDGDNMVTVKGKLTIETDLTNREREVIAGKEVRVVNNNLGSSLESSFVGTTDENGEYAVKVPVSPQGNDYLSVYFPSEIEAEQTLAVKNDNGTYEVTNVPAKFYNIYYNASSIKTVPSVYATIDAPKGTGSGFALAVKKVGSYFSSYSHIEIVKGGSGYDAGSDNYEILSLSAGDNGKAAKVRVWVDDNGAISAIDYLYGYYNSEGEYTYFHNGALYTSAPTLDLSSLGGTGAVIDIEFETGYKVYIKNHGSGYFSIPKVSASYKEYQNHTVVKNFDNNLNSGNELNGYGLNDYLSIHDGAIYTNINYANGGDTLFTTIGLIEAPELTVASTAAEQAEISLGVSNGSVYLSSWDGGSGYDPANPPAVTLTTLADQGEGAAFEVEVGTNGSISNFILKSKGEGYAYNLNDFDGDGSSSASSDNFVSGSQSLSNVEPGSVHVVNAYYGTGIRE